MADLTTNNSTYATGTNDTATTLVNNVSPTDAKHINGPNTGIIQIQTVLGSGTTLIGSTADLASRLAESLEPDGKLSTVPITEGGTGIIAVAQGKILTSSGSALVAVDKFRKNVYTANDTFTAPANVTLVYVQIWGAGGGGGGGQGGEGSGGVPAPAATNYGGRGFHGGYAADTIAVTPGNNYTITIGAGGTAGAGGAGGVNPGEPGALGGSGGAGGNTSFVGSSTFTATGGNGGSGNYITDIFTTAEVSGSTASILIKSGGRGGGLGGAPNGGGNTGPAGDGSAGNAGEGGVIVVWY